MKAQAVLSHLNDIQIALQQRNYPKAHKHLSKCASNPPKEPALLQQLLQAAQLLQANDLSLKLLQRAEALSKANVEQLMQIGNDYLRIHALEQASALFQRLVKSSPNHPDAHYKLGWIANQQLQFEEAIRHFTHQLAVNPSHEMAAYLLARCYERSHQLDKAEQTTSEALKHLPNSTILRGIVGLLHYRKDDYTQAITILDEVATKISDPFIRMEFLTLLGKAYDKLNDNDKAFQRFSNANDIAYEQAKARYNLPQFRKEIDIKTSLLTKEWIANWPKTTADEEAENFPTFLIGFPRSGTTLLDQILSTHDRVEVMEEQECLSDMCAALPSNIQQYSSTLQNLSDTEVQKLRKLYNNSVRKRFKSIDAHGLLIDKFPLNLMKIDVIQRIFPGAKIILAARHPCDAILSAYMQSFEINPSMAQMTNLDDACHFYDSLFNLWRKAAEELPLNYHIVKYEALIEDFDSESKKLTEFLGLEWQDAMRDFHQNAAKRGFINTPSYTEVIKPINNSAVDRWKRYQKQLAPYLPLLKPHAEYLGYEI